MGMCMSVLSIIAKGVMPYNLIIRVCLCAEVGWVDIGLGESWVKWPMGKMVLKETRDQRVLNFVHHCISYDVFAPLRSTGQKDVDVTCSSGASGT